MRAGEKAASVFSPGTMRGRQSWNAVAGLWTDERTDDWAAMALSSSHPSRQAKRRQSRRRGQHGVSMESAWSRVVRKQDSFMRVYGSQMIIDGWRQLSGSERPLVFGSCRNMFETCKTWGYQDPHTSSLGRFRGLKLLAILVGSPRRRNSK